MKSRFGKVSLSYVIFIFAFLFGIGILGCTNDGNPTDKTKNKFPTIISDSFFWGTWVRMDNGEEYEILESNVIRNYTSFTITDSSIDSLSVSGLGTFKKESDSVIVCDNIPYFRKGGANLEYSLKIVGFTSSETISSNKSLVSRAAGTNVSGIKGKGKSKKYKNFESDSESDEDGTIIFTAPTANDPQTVELITDDDEIVIITGLEVSNDGDNMGTVALVGKDDYNLKITGKISDDQKDGGYLFGNNAKTYEMEISITNVSVNKCSSSGCTIKSADEKLSINSSVNLEGFPITTLVPHTTKTISVKLTYGELSEPYVDTGLIITIENPLTNQTWEDYIPLRFFKGTIPITIAAKNPENNNNAALNGFVIYPDGNNQFFAIKHNDCKPIFVPTFGSEKPYKLVFSGATVTAQLSDSTEMFYTVEPASLTPRTVVTDGMDAIRTYIPFGGNNHSENNAYSVTEGFEAYLNEGEIDYYSINADSDEFYGPGGSLFYSVSYINEKGDAPESFLTVEGATLNSRQLPEMECEGYEFLGWYDGDRKVETGSYTITYDVILEAKWTDKCIIKYISKYGNNPEPILIDKETTFTSIQLPKLTDKNWIFKGWYTDPKYDDNTRIEIGYTITKSISLYAKWIERTYPENGFVFVEGGTIIGSNDYAYTSVFPIGRIIILNSFYICDHEVTQGEYEKIIGKNPSNFNPYNIKSDTQNRPVETISWYDAIYFCNKKSIIDNLIPCYTINGKTNPEEWEYNPSSIYNIGIINCDFSANGYRLPTEAEWEFAARGGMDTYGTKEFKSYYFSGTTTIDYISEYNRDLDDFGWYCYNSDSETHNIKSKKSNILGLYDMSGNVWEWCWDWFDIIYSGTDAYGATSGSKRVIRGGSFNNYARYCSISNRDSKEPDHKNFNCGFRLVCSAE